MLYYCFNLHSKQSFVKQSAKYFCCYGNLCLNWKFNFSKTVKNIYEKLGTSYYRKVNELTFPFALIGKNYGLIQRYPSISTENIGMKLVFN